MKMRWFQSLSAAVLSGFSFGAMAADLPSRAPPPAMPPVVAADSYQPFQIRLDATGVVPGNGGYLNLVNGGGYVSSGFKASYSVVPTLDLTYFVTKNLAVQLFCCVSPHNLFLNQGPLANTQVAHTWLFPPTLLFQYHFTNFGQFQPYLGVGVNYTHYFAGERIMLS